MGPEEVNADERIRIQLWDSDRTSADDDLGRIEVDLKELMHSPQSKGKIWDRTDGFLALEGESTLGSCTASGLRSRVACHDWKANRNTILSFMRICFY